MKFSMTKSVYLRGYQQLFLDHAESVGQTQDIFVRANRHPQALCLTLHPTKIDTYIVGTDEGCLYICSTDHPHQHLSVFQVHNGSVYSIAYSPWSPKIFLTCGSDWLIRIWVDDVFEPLLELSCNIGAVLDAQWSPIHSTILISCQKNSIAVWDLRKKNMKPASMHPFGSGTSGLTIANFSNCGRTMIVGDEEGKIDMLAMEDMPFSPHYQYQELQAALYRGLTSKPELLKEVKSLGYLGYLD
jgi:dynein intermediate chain 4, axonemal